LNFEIRETPFSIFLTLRKSFNQNLKVQSSPMACWENPRTSAELSAQLEALKTENHSLKVRNSFLEKSNDTLTDKLAQEVKDAEEQVSELKDTTEKLNKLHASFNNVEISLQRRIS
jgi:molecular chaperone GrpE (heat shock protein)